MKDCVLGKKNSVNGRSITWIDTEIVRCITECAPGPHAFLSVLKVERFTVQEQEVIKKICQYFSEEAFKYAIVLVTHGDELPEGMKIKECANQSKHLSDLVKKCGSRIVQIVNLSEANL